MGDEKQIADIFGVHEDMLPEQSVAKQMEANAAEVLRALARKWAIVSGLEVNEAAFDEASAYCNQPVPIRAEGFNV